MEYAGGESGPRRKFAKQTSDSALDVGGPTDDLLGGGVPPPTELRREHSGPAEAPLAFQQRDVVPPPPLTFRPQGAASSSGGSGGGGGSGSGGPPVGQLLNDHGGSGGIAGGSQRRPRNAIGQEYQSDLNDSHLHRGGPGPASRAVAVAEAGRREKVRQNNACGQINQSLRTVKTNNYGQINQSTRTVNVYDDVLMAPQQQPTPVSDRPRRKRRGQQRNKKSAAQRAAEEDEEHQRQREAYMSSNLYSITSPPQPGEEGHAMHTEILALNDEDPDGETIGRKVGRIARRMSFGALSAVSGLTGPGDSMCADSSSSSSSESSEDDEDRGRRRRYGGGINTMGKIGFDEPGGTWDGDMVPPASGALNDEEVLLHRHQERWEQPPQWKPPEEPTLGRKIGRMARRMSQGAMSAGVLTALGGDGEGNQEHGDGNGLRRGQKKASSINLSTLAQLDFDGLSDDDHDAEARKHIKTGNAVDVQIAAEHGEIVSAGGSAGNAVPFTIDVGARGGGRRGSRMKAGRRRSRGAHSPSAATSLRDLPIFNAVGDINPGGINPGGGDNEEEEQTTYYQDAKQNARKAVKKGRKMARRMSSGSLYALGFDMAQSGGADQDSDSTDDAPEPGDADYVPPSTHDLTSLADTAMASRVSRRGSHGKYSSLPTRVIGSMPESGIGDFDPDNIVTIGMEEEAEEYELEMRKRRKISICVAVGVLVAVVAALAGGTAKAFMWWGPGSSSDSIGVAQQTDQLGTLPEPPSDLDRVCSVRNMATEAGHRDCEKLCSPATCCMKSGEHSCYSKHESMCEKYSYCGTLYTYTETAYGDTATSDATTAVDLHITPPPANLDVFCSDSSLETPAGYLDCLSTCHHGSCCVSLRSAQFGGEGEFGTTSVPSIQSCRDSHADICSAYEPCLKLWEAGHSDPVQIVRDVCTKKSVATSDGRDQCESLCRARSCCFAQDDRNCRVDNKNWCEEYSACEILIDDRPSTNAIAYGDHSEPKQYECDQSKITTSISLLMCEESCMTAACPCFGGLSDWNCNARSTTNNIDCKEWEYCRPLLANLVEDGDTIGHGGGEGDRNNGILQSISSACNKDNIQSSKGKEECFELCEDHMCCFGGCQDDKECGLYANCWNLLDTSDADKDAFEDGPKLRPPPDDLEELCEPSTLDQDIRRTQCQEACSIGQCCMGIGFSCQTNIKYCLQFAACDIIWEPELYSPMGVGDGSQSPGSSKDAPISVTCAPDSLKSSLGQEACDKACSEWSCCWDQDENCFDANPSVCVEYMACPGAR